MEGLACITGFLCWARLTPKFWRVFPFYLLVITCCEFAGWYMNSHQLQLPAKLMYNYLVIPLEFFFLYFLYFHVLAKEFRTTVLALAALFIIAFITEYVLLLNVKWMWRSLTYITGSLTILILSVIFLLQTIRSEAVLSYRRQPFFWVNLGVILFYVGTFPYYATINYLYKINEPLFWCLAWIFVVLNYIMYTLFIVGFLCFRKPREY